ncbi:site-specific integrase [Streptomyces sp. HUAS TT7]|uniref:site-specific integrase n=1 Tax=Streptomyces sp. HUAS TT7 TaxID=3447507 RepID=UPI003F660205
MEQMFYSSDAWESWDLAFKPAIPEGMPLLFDDDLLLEDPGGPRTAAVVNRWACELPVNGCPAPKSWPYYVRTVREWMEFAAEHGVTLFDSRDRLKSVLGAYAVHRATGPMDSRFAASTWNQSMGILSGFYRWAMAEGYTTAEPFTYKQATGYFNGQFREVSVNRARRRQPKEHVTIKYLEEDFQDLFLKGLAGLRGDGEPDPAYRGRELARNAAVGRSVLSNGLRCQEFTYLLVCEIPPLPERRSSLPVSFPVPAGVTKGTKYRESWIDYDALAELHGYVDLEREMSVYGSSWRPPARWGDPLMVTEFDARGGRINGRRVPWELMTPGQRRRLVGPDGGSMLLSVWGNGRPFTSWPSVFKRTANRIRERFEPRFPHVAPHRLRHSMAMSTMIRLVRGYYEQAARQVRDADDDAGLALYLRKTEPLLILRDLLGHSSALTTEKYLHRIDTTRIFRELYSQVGREYGLLDEEAAVREAAEEFDDELEYA